MKLLKSITYMKVAATEEQSVMKVAATEEHYFHEISRQ
jgi:hypothetical protein